MEIREKQPSLFRRLSAAISAPSKAPKEANTPKSPTEDRHRSTLRKAGGTWESWLESEYPPK